MYTEFESVIRRLLIAGYECGVTKGEKIDYSKDYLPSLNSREINKKMAALGFPNSEELNMNKPEKTELHNAIEVLKKHLTNNSGYRETWHANLSCAYQDAMAKKNKGESSNDRMIGNLAADRFLYGLAGKPEETKETNLSNNIKQICVDIKTGIDQANKAIGKTVFDYPRSIEICVDKPVWTNITIGMPR